MPSQFKLLAASTMLAGTTRKVSDAIRHQRLVMEEFSSLGTLRSIVGVHGLTRPLLAYANRGSTLGKIVPALPATESLNQVPLSLRDTRHTASIEGMDEALGKQSGVVATWVRDLAGDLGSMLASTAMLADGVSASVHELSSALASKNVSDVTLDTSIVTTRTAVGFDDIFTALQARVAQIDSVDVEKFFTSEDYRKSCETFIAGLVAEFKPMMGATLHEGHFVHAGADVIDESYMPREGTLAELGYTAEASAAVLEKISALLQEYQTFTATHAEIVEKLIEVSDRMASPDLDAAFDADEAHCIVSNYAGAIVMLVGDGFTHIHEALDVVGDVVEASDERSEDGRSD